MSIFNSFENHTPAGRHELKLFPNGSLISLTRSKSKSLTDTQLKGDYEFSTNSIDIFKDFQNLTASTFSVLRRICSRWKLIPTLARMDLIIHSSGNHALLLFSHAPLKLIRFLPLHLVDTPFPVPYMKFLLFFLSSMIHFFLSCYAFSTIFRESTV